MLCAEIVRIVGKVPIAGRARLGHAVVALVPVLMFASITAGAGVHSAAGSQSLSPTKAAVAKVGGKCPKVGKTVRIRGKTLICKKVGRKRVWKVKPSTPTPSPSPSPTPTPNAGSVYWTWNELASEWRPSGTAPECTFPPLPDGSLFDFTSAPSPISILQPGQSRGGSYKPHGGLRWSSGGDPFVPGVSVHVPFDGYVVGAWHYRVSDPAVPEGIYQFGLNLVSPCGVMVRLGHLATPSAQFTTILSALPPAAVDDSRENDITPVAVHAGDTIATDVGIYASANPDVVGTFVDFGLLDLRAVNPVLPPGFTSNADIKYSKYSVCWYEGSYMGSGDRAAAAALPVANGDGTSDYCMRT